MRDEARAYDGYHGAGGKEGGPAHVRCRGTGAARLGGAGEEEAGDDARWGGDEVEVAWRRRSGGERGHRGSARVPIQIQ